MSRATGRNSSQTLAFSRNLRSRAAPSHAAVSALGYVESRQIICAISESRGVSPTIGLAFVDLETSQVTLCQICDTKTYVKTVQKLHIYRPSEILFMDSTFHGYNASKLRSTIDENLDNLDCVATSLNRKYWAEDVGLDYIKRLPFLEDLEIINIAVAGSYFAVCCLAAVGLHRYLDPFYALRLTHRATKALKYIEDINDRQFGAHTLHFRVEPSQGSMMIDISTMTSLELIQNLRSVESKDCLFGALRNTLTPMGSRLLRNNIMQPLTHTTTLSLRFDAVDEIIGKEKMFSDIRNGLLRSINLG